MVAAAPDLMREYLADPERVRAYCVQLYADSIDPESSSHRTAQRLVPEILRAVGAETVLMQALIMQIGGSPERAKEALELVGSVPEDVHTMAREAQAFLDWYHGPNGAAQEVGGAR